MAAIPGICLAQLQAAGLLISEPFDHDHEVFPDGVVVAKQSSVPGNYLPDYECWCGGMDVLLNGPAVWFHSDAPCWVVTSHDYVPGPGPGDFVNIWRTPEEGVADILDFYFGNPNRMQVKQSARTG